MPPSSPECSIHEIRSSRPQHQMSKVLGNHGIWWIFQPRVPPSSPRTNWERLGRQTLNVQVISNTWDSTQCPKSLGITGSGGSSGPTQLSQNEQGMAAKTNLESPARLQPPQTGFKRDSEEFFHPWNSWMNARWTFLHFWDKNSQTLPVLLHQGLSWETNTQRFPKEANPRRG